MSLLNEPPYQMNLQQKQSALIEELYQEYLFQFEQSSLFRKICLSNGSKLDKMPSSLSEFPFLPVQYFKEAGRELKVDESKTHRFLQSSATSGVPSTISVDRETSKRQIRALANVLSDFMGEQRRAFWVCDLDQTVGHETTEFPARLAAMQGFLSFASTREYLLTQNPGGSLVPNFELIEKLSSEIKKNHSEEPMVICGFTFLIWTALLKPLKDRGIKINLPRNSKIIHIGGWKKLEDQKVSREILLLTAKEVFGIDSDQIVDIYGFTEQMGTLYAECAHGYKHSPVFADVLVRHPVTFELLKDGKIGIGQFFSLVPHSYPGFSLLTDDIIQVQGRDTCNCGRKGTFFKVLGRSSKAEIRGCGDVIAQKVFKEETTALEENNSYEILFGNEVTIKKQNYDLQRIKKELAVAHHDLKQLSCDDIICLLKHAAELWKTEERFLPYQKQGLAYLINWIYSGTLQQNADFSLRGSRLALDSLTNLEGDHRKFMAIPRGTVVHWLAGNVPTLGLISLFISLVSKNTNILKLPRESGPFLSQLLYTLSKIEVTTTSGRRLKGEFLSNAIKMVYVTRNSEDARALSEVADARIAWGGAEAVKSIMQLPRQYDAIDLTFGPKISLAAIGREALISPSKARRLARNLAIDICVFNQEACASAHNVFIEKGGVVSPREFLDFLAEKMDENHNLDESTEDNSGVLGNVKSARIKHYIDGEVLSPQGLEWSILFRDKLEYNEPVYGKTALVRAVDQLEEIIPFISRENQVVGLALPVPRRNELAIKLAQAGVDRITQVGHMADFNSPWDGIFPMEKLIRWVSIS